MTITRFNEDQSADCLRTMVAEKTPFIFIRFGDGALECINNKFGKTCDGEVYSYDLGKELTRVWNLLFTRYGVVMGDWLSASFSPESTHGLYRDEYEDLISKACLNGRYVPNWIHFESLLLMRESQSLVEFYRTVRTDTRKKLLMGPREWQPAADVLQAEFLEIPVSANLFNTHLDQIKSGLESSKFDVLLYGAGMAGNIPVIDFWNEHPFRTYINLGSALDPVYRGRTRRQQLPQDRARALFNSIVAR